MLPETFPPTSDISPFAGRIDIDTDGRISMSSDGALEIKGNGITVVRERSNTPPIDTTNQDADKLIAIGAKNASGIPTDLRQRRLPPPKDRDTFNNAIRYSPQVRVHDVSIKSQFVQMARDFIRLETYMTEFFRNFGRSFMPSDIENRLTIAEQIIAKKQNMDVSSADIGDLGKFCAGQFSAWLKSSAETESLSFYPVFKDDDDCIKYLQNGYAILYWDIIMDMFHQLRRDLLGETHNTMMMSVITSTFTLISAKHHRLQETHGLALSSSTNNLDIIIGGIERRTHFLEGILRANLSNPEDVNLIIAVMPILKAKHRKDSALATGEHSMRRKPGENTWYGVFAFFVCSVMLSLVPGCIGFSKSWMDEETGDFSDADFWYLVQSSIVSTFANVTTLMLFERSDLPSPNILVWATIVAGTICNVVSIAIYPNFMPGWSALLSFVGTVSSASCVVISTHTAAIGRAVPVKSKTD